MKCDVQNSLCINCGGAGGDECAAEIHLDELRAMEAETIPRRAVKITSVQVQALANRDPSALTTEEKRQLFGPLDDPTLIGNRIAEVTKRFGIPPCDACEGRKAWINAVHQWLRETFQAGTPAG